MTAFGASSSSAFLFSNFKRACNVDRIPPQLRPSFCHIDLRPLLASSTDLVLAPAAAAAAVVAATFDADFNAFLISYRELRPWGERGSLIARYKDHLRRVKNSCCVKGPLP